MLARFGLGGAYRRWARSSSCAPPPRPPTHTHTLSQDFSFPPKTVLVLGREREGIPAELLAALHATVEIPQLGLIRSLNVHVSASIALFEYTRQRLVGPQ